MQIIVVISYSLNQIEKACIENYHSTSFASLKSADVRTKK